MPFTSIVCGLLLILIGAAGYVTGVMNEKASVTALIPAFFGMVLLALGLISNTKESLRKHLMHVAIVVALLGFLATAGRLVMAGNFTTSPAVLSQAAMAVICLVFVILAVRSFTAARKDA